MSQRSCGSKARTASSGGSAASIWDWRLGERAELIELVQVSRDAAVCATASAVWTTRSAAEREVARPDTSSPPASSRAIDDQPALHVAHVDAGTGGPPRCRMLPSTSGFASSRQRLVDRLDERLRQLAEGLASLDRRARRAAARHLRRSSRRAPALADLVPDRPGPATPWSGSSGRACRCSRRRSRRSGSSSPSGSRDGRSASSVARRRTSTVSSARFWCGARRGAVRDAAPRVAPARRPRNRATDLDLAGRSGMRTDRACFFVEFRDEARRGAGADRSRVGRPRPRRGLE